MSENTEKTGEAYIPLDPESRARSQELLESILEYQEDDYAPDETREWDGVDESVAEGEEPEQEEDAPDQSVEEPDEGQHLDTESEEGDSE